MVVCCYVGSGNQIRSLQMQQVLLTTEPSLLSQQVLLLKTYLEQRAENLTITTDNINHILCHIVHRVFYLTQSSSQDSEVDIITFLLLKRKKGSGRKNSFLQTP